MPSNVTNPNVTVNIPSCSSKLAIRCSLGLLLFLLEFVPTSVTPLQNQVYELSLHGGLRGTDDSVARDGSDRLN